MSEALIIYIILFSDGEKNKITYVLHENDHLTNIEVSMKQKQITYDYLSF